MSVRVEVKEEGNCLRLLEVEVPAEDVQEAYDRVLRDIKKTARIPGFRPGKAPLDLLRKRFASDARSEVMKRLINSSYAKAVYEAALHPIRDPEIRDTVLEENRPFTYRAVVEIRPRVDLGQYIGLELEKRSPSVFSNDVEQALERLRETHATFESAEGHAAQKGDRVVMDYEGLADGEPFEHNKGQNVTYELGSRRLLPEFEEALLGKMVGDKFEVAIDFPADYDHKSLAGKRCVFQVELKVVKRKVLPSLDDEFAKDCGQPSLDELRSHVRRELEMSATAWAEEAVRSQAMKKVTDSSRFELSESLISALTTNRLKEQAESLRRAGLKDDQVKAELEKHLETVREGVAYDLKVNAVIETIAARENIAVAETEIDESIKRLIDRMGSNSESAKEYFNLPETREKHRANLLTKKVFDFIINSARVTEVQGDV